MASKHPKVETFATISAENAEYRRILPQLQAQAQQAMMMAAQEKGKYLHVLKILAAILEQNMHKGIETVVLHKTIVDQPDTINIARDEAEGGYSYRVVTQEEIEALSENAGSGGAVDSGDGGGAGDAVGNPENEPEGEHNNGSVPDGECSLGTPETASS